MGRPLNKKFFGNRNVGSTTTTADNYGIGGKTIASVTVSGTNNNYSSFPTIVFAAPSIPSGETATGTCVAGVVSVTLTAAGTGYAVNDVITLVGGTGTAATLTVTAITGGGATGPIGTVSVTTAGAYTALTDLTDLAVTGPGNDDATFTVTALKIVSVTMTKSGSGYTSVPGITDTPDGNATLTAVYGVDSGSVGSSTNQENAIQITAWVPASGAAGNVSGDGTSAVLGDILRQVGSKKYVVKTAQGVGRVTLVADTPAAGEATIIATDANGNTYYVTKLTAHKAKLTRLVDDGGDLDWLFATGEVAQWSFEAASGFVVQIANA